MLLLRVLFRLQGLLSCVKPLSCGNIGGADYMTVSRGDLLMSMLSAVGLYPFFSHTA